MSKIVISGYYGFNNLGDEAILESMVESMKQLFHNTSALNTNPEDICVLSANPQLTSRSMNVSSVNRSKFISVVSAIMHCDIFISGGGSLLQDITSKWSIRYYLALIWWALVCRKKVFLYAHGIGPVHGRLNRWLMKWIIKHVDIISVRDEKSMVYLISAGIDKQKIHLTADPVIGMSNTDKVSGKKILEHAFGSMDYQSKPLVGISLRSKDFSTDEIRQKLKYLIKSLGEEYNIIFLPFHLGEDMDICQWIVQENIADNITAIVDSISAKDMMSVVENLDILVGERLHSLIFASVAKIHFIGISYDLKIDAFMNIFSRKALCDVSEFIHVDLKKEIADRLSSAQEVLDAQNNTLSALRLDYAKNLELLEQFM